MDEADGFNLRFAHVDHVARSCGLLSISHAHRCNINQLRLYECPYCVLLNHSASRTGIEKTHPYRCTAAIYDVVQTQRKMGHIGMLSKWLAFYHLFYPI